MRTAPETIADLIGDTTEMPGLIPGTWDIEPVSSELAFGTQRRHYASAALA
jgi:hypothetical protein